MGAKLVRAAGAASLKWDWRVEESSTYKTVLLMDSSLSRRIDSAVGGIHSTGSATYLAKKFTGARVRNRSDRASPLRKCRWTAQRFADASDRS